MQRLSGFSLEFIASKIQTFTKKTTLKIIYRLFKNILNHWLHFILLSCYKRWWMNTTNKWISSICLGSASKNKIIILKTGIVMIVKVKEKWRNEKKTEIVSAFRQSFECSHFIFDKKTCQLNGKVDILIVFITGWREKSFCNTPNHSIDVYLESHFRNAFTIAIQMALSILAPGETMNDFVIFTPISLILFVSPLQFK